MLSERSHTQKDTQGVTPLRRNVQSRSKVSPSSSWEMPSGPRVSACMGKDSLSSTESACVRNPSRRDFRACSLTSSLRITQFSWNPGDGRSFWSRKRHERDGL
ncbi:uncharacterized protein [Tursiops truncatus]|uniref:uncharacterized protein isoform X3 n=1 Tax=Tursiops truncatus TaxID=9739 RepID=UPI003CCFCD4A